MKRATYLGRKKYLRGKLSTHVGIVILRGYNFVHNFHPKIGFFRVKMLAHRIFVHNAHC